MNEIRIDSVNTDIGDIEINLDEQTREKPSDITETCKKEIGENLQKIKEYEKKFKDRMEIEGDADFYFQVVFKSAKEKKAFLQKHGIILECNDYIFIEDFEPYLKEVSE